MRDAEVPSQDGHERYILVVEDDPVVRTTMAMALMDEPGIIVVEVGDGRSVFNAIDRVVPSLIVLDIGLPRIDGDEVCRRLKADPRMRGVPVLAVSTGSRAKLAHAAGCDAFIEKPFLVDQFLATVHELLAA